VAAYLEGGGPVQFGGVGRVGRHVGDVGDELLQEVAAQLQVGGVYDHLHQLEDAKHQTSGPFRGKINTFIL